VSAGLIGHQIDPNPAPDQLGQHLRCVAEQADRQRPAGTARDVQAVQSVVQVGGRGVEVARLEPAADALRVHLDDQRRAAVQRHGQRLRAAHATKAGRDGERSS